MFEDINEWMLPKVRAFFLCSLLHLLSVVLAFAVNLRDGDGALVAQLPAARGLLFDGALRVLSLLSNLSVLALVLCAHHDFYADFARKF